jgi:uncharacterized protein (TIGR02217 family)
MAFFETEFPTTISYRALGGPGFSTTINEGFSGYEQRNRNWAYTRAKWTVSLMTPVNFAGDRQAFIDLLQSFFLNVGGRADAFRLKDHKDFQATGQTIGLGDGHTTVFQLTKTYTVGARSYVRTIQKPIAPPAIDYQGNALANTVKIYLNGVLQSSGWTVDGTTGLVTFSAAPAGSVVIDADFHFHFPVRFDTDEFQAQVEESDIGAGPIVSWNSIALLEVRL